MAERDIVAYLGADISSLSRAMRMAQARVSSAMNHIKRDMNDAENNVGSSGSGISKHMKNMQNSIGGVMGGIKKSIISGLIGSLSAAIPIAGAIVTGAGAMSSALLSAGVGFVGFGAVAVGVLGKVFTATDKTYGELDAQQKKAYKSLKDFKSFFSDFSKGFEGGIVDIFSQSLGVLKNVLTKMKPAIQGTMEAVGKLVNGLNQSLDSPDIKKFFDWMGKTAGGYVLSFGQIFGNIFRGVLNLIMAFSPLADGVVNGLSGMTQSFAEWSSKLSSSQGFQNFINYVKNNTPFLISLIGNLGSVIVGLIQILAPIGSIALQALSGFVLGVKQTVEQIKQAFSVNNFQGVGQALAGIIPQIFNTLIAFLPQIIGMGGQIVGNLILGISQAIPQIVQSAILFIQTFMNNLMTNFPLLLNAGLQLAMALINGIISALPNLLTTGLTMIQTLVTSLTNAVVTFLPQILQSAIQLVLALIQGIVSALPQIVQSAISLIQTILSTILQQLPVILLAGIQILDALVQGITTMLPQLVNMAISLITTVVTMLMQNLPKIIDAGIKLVNALIEGILQILPQLIPLALNLLDTILDVLIKNLPLIINAGVKLLLSLIDGIIDALPQLIQLALTLILKLVASLLSHLPQIISVGVKILVALIGGLIQAIPKLISAIPKIVRAIVNAFKSVDWGSVGTNIMKGIGNGLSSMLGWLKGKASSIAKGLLNSAKSALGIHSPSRVFADEVGKYIPAGIGKGIEDNSKLANNAVGDVSKSLVTNFKLSDMVVPMPSLATQSGSANTGVHNGYERPINLVVNLDSYEVAKATYPHIDDMQSSSFRSKVSYTGGKS